MLLIYISTDVCILHSVSSSLHCMPLCVKPILYITLATDNYLFQCHQMSIKTTKKGLLNSINVPLICSYLNFWDWALLKIYFIVFLFYHKVKIHWIMLK